MASRSKHQLVFVCALLLLILSGCTSRPPSDSRGDRKPTTIATVQQATSSAASEGLQLSASVVAVDEVLRARLHLQSNKKRATVLKAPAGALGWVELRSRDGRVVFSSRGVGSSGTDIVEQPIQAGEELSVEIEVPMPRRGEYELFALTEDPAIETPPLAIKVK